MPTWVFVLFFVLLVFGLMQTRTRGGKAETSSIRAPASSKAELLYLAQVGQPGRYLLEFSAQVKGSDGQTNADSEWAGFQVLEIAPTSKH